MLVIDNIVLYHHHFGYLRCSLQSCAATETTYNGTSTGVNQTNANNQHNGKCSFYGRSHLNKLIF